MKILPAAHPALAKILFVIALEWELALQWPQGKHLRMQKHCIWIKYQGKKAIFRNTQDLPKYSLLEAKRRVLEGFTELASWQAGFDCVSQISTEETKLLLS